MDSGFDPGALLARTYALPSGLRVTLRLARARDRAGLEALLRGQAASFGDVPFDELEPARLVNFDVSGRVVLCATALIDMRERLIGVGVIELTGSDAGPDHPTSVIVDPAYGEGLVPLLRDALLGQAGVMRRVRRAA